MIPIDRLDERVAIARLNSGFGRACFAAHQKGIVDEIGQLSR
jgi:hypothetical protein